MQEKAERQSDHCEKQMLLDKEAMLLGFQFLRWWFFDMDGFEIHIRWKRKRSTFISLVVLCVHLTVHAHIGFKDFVGSLVLDYKYLDVHRKTISNGSFLYTSLMCWLLS